MEQIELLIFWLFFANMGVLGVLSYVTLRDRETNKKEMEDLQSEVERLKRNLTL